MKERGEKFTCLTSYESTLTSKICDVGVDVVLVGDSLDYHQQVQHPLLHRIFLMLVSIHKMLSK